MLKQLFRALRYSGVVGSPSPLPLHPLHAVGEIVVNEAACHSCKQCVKACPVGALKVEGQPEPWLLFHPERCLNCVRCVEACPKKALSFRPAAKGFADRPFFQAQKVMKLEKGER